MPVLPDVASTMVVLPGSMSPSASAASIIATPMRSLTLPPGLNDSSLPKIRTPSGAIRASSIIGVRPTCSAMLAGMRVMLATPYPAARAGAEVDVVPRQVLKQPFQGAAALEHGAGRDLRVPQLPVVLGVAGVPVQAVVEV